MPLDDQCPRARSSRTRCGVGWPRCTLPEWAAAVRCARGRRRGPAQARTRTRDDVRRPTRAAGCATGQSQRETGLPRTPALVERIYIACAQRETRQPRSTFAFALLVLFSLCLICVSMALFTAPRLLTHILSCRRDIGRRACRTSGAARREARRRVLRAGNHVL